MTLVLPGNESLRHTRHKAVLLLTMALRKGELSGLPRSRVLCTGVARAILRRSKIATTLEVYTEVATEQFRDALQKPGQSLNGPTE
ncbi:hypothetical protein HNR23_002367 [Nocardiopsis mwathae]|uniref:Uncharacterized protein n=1 Tax=Nocardiopsis mwathae TaxID=1472723 RepID=A0A7X0D5E3_9ACTN|nr:hypothetical protein [Nocardiopsis mwathae]MBB6172307.1 hypothetical protein [Nocardiopsis mwathae]